MMMNLQNLLRTTQTKFLYLVTKIHLTKTQIVLLSCGFAFIIAGIIVGNCTMIFHKAVFICLECIGIE